MGNGAFLQLDFVFDEVTTTDIRLFSFKCSISSKTGLSDSSSYDEGRSGKFRRPFRISLKRNFE